MDISAEQVKAVMDDPGKALELNEEQLDAVLLAAVGLYGSTGAEELVEKLMLLYRHAVTRIHPARRLRNYQAMVDRVIAGETGAHALMPYLCCDPDLSITSMAALDYAVLAPHGDALPTAAAVELIEMYRRGVLENGLAVLGGLLMSGDKRIISMIEPVCRELTCEEVEVLIRLRGSFLTTAVCEFYLDWLDILDSQADSEIFGAVAAGLANLAYDAQDQMVYEIERVIPSSADDAVRILNEWAFSEYALTIAGRLQALADKETVEPIIPEVQEIWGLA